MDILNITVSSAEAAIAFDVSSDTQTEAELLQRARAAAYPADEAEILPALDDVLVAARNAPTTSTPPTTPHSFPTLDALVHALDNWSTSHNWQAPPASFLPSFSHVLKFTGTATSNARTVARIEKININGIYWGHALEYQDHTWIYVAPAFVGQRNSKTCPVGRKWRVLAWRGWLGAEDGFSEVVATSKGWWKSIEEEAGWGAGLMALDKNERAVPQVSQVSSRGLKRGVEEEGEWEDETARKKRKVVGVAAIHIDDAELDDFEYAQGTTQHKLRAQTLLPGAMRREVSCSRCQARKIVCRQANGPKQCVFCVASGIGSAYCVDVVSA